MTDEERIPIAQALPGMTLHALPAAWTPVEALVLIKCLDEDGDVTWCYRTSASRTAKSFLEPSSSTRTCSVRNCWTSGRTRNRCRSTSLSVAALTLHSGLVTAVGWVLSYVLPAALSGWAAHAVATRRLAIRPLWTIAGVVLPVLGATLTVLLAGRFAWDVQEPATA